MSQGNDGTPHLTYYDKAHALSFVWDGTEDGDDRWIDVSYGGYSEPMILRIPWRVHLTGPAVGSVLNDVLAAFARTCEEFINFIHQIEDTTVGGHR